MIVNAMYLDEDRIKYDLENDQIIMMRALGVSFLLFSSAQFSKLLFLLMQREYQLTLLSPLKEQE